MMGLDIDQFFDEQIGDWGMFEEIDRRKMTMEISSPSTPPVQEVQESSDESEKKVPSV
jgi:Amt family ammonium transporter